MNTQKRIFEIAVGVTLLLPLITATVGCGQNTAPAQEDPKVTQARVDTAKEIRTYFDKVNGNYEALTPEDKAAVNKLMGGEENARKGFSLMPGAKPGGAPAGATTAPPASGSGLPATGPGAH